jgi:hypothetical protein
VDLGPGAGGVEGARRGQGGAGAEGDVEDDVGVVAELEELAWLWAVDAQIEMRRALRRQRDIPVAAVVGGGATRAGVCVEDLRSDREGGGRGLVNCWSGCVID